MSVHRRTRLTALGGAAALVIGLLAALSPQSALAHHAGAAPGPVNAQSTFKWGRPQFQDEFEYARRARHWDVRGRGNVRNQFGQLTLNTARKGSTSATLDRRGHATGRWEIRLRSHRYETAHTNYKVLTELIPAGDRDQHCGARNIGLERYQFGHRRANFYIRNRPGHQFTARKVLNLSNDRWHTFGVEVTKHRISWFVDAHVIRSERRGASRSGVPLTVRFTMQGKPGARMNRSRMQMDWLRYFDLHRPNRKSTKAPQAHRGHYKRAC